MLPSPRHCAEGKGGAGQGSGRQGHTAVEVQVTGVWVGARQEESGTRIVGKGSNRCSDWDSSRREGQGAYV